MDISELIKKAENAGFSHVKELNMSALVPLPAVRDMCAADKCNMYNKNWCCPPGCGSLPEMKEKMDSFSAGVLVQTTAELEDDFDFETMMSAEAEHKQHFLALHDELCNEGIHCLFMATGTCTNCKECTFPDAPCRFPERAMPSMEACGLLVSDVCKTSDLPYYYGKGTLTYTACILIR